MTAYIELRVSKDGANTWSDWKARSLGDTGDFIKPVIWRRLGNSRHFTFDFRATGVPDILAGSILDANGEWVEAPVVGGAYGDENRPWSSQDTCNYVPVAAEKQGVRSMAKLRGVPGERLFANVGPGPIRGARDVEGKLFVVSGTGLYRVFADTSSTLLGTIPGSGRCSLTHNQEGGGSKLVIGNGTRGYTYDTITEVFAEIDDEAFPGFLTCDYLDQFILGIEPQRRFAFHSELADAREYSSIDQLESESSPDRLLGQAVNAGQWWLFGERTIDVYANTGAGTGTFQRIPGSTVDRGIAGTYALAKLDNTLFFWGDDGTFYRLNGYTPVRVSTHPIEQAARVCDLSGIFCMVYEDAGHKIVWSTFPDGNTWGYDVSSGEWFRRQSFGRQNWRMSTLVKWLGVWLAGDAETGKLYQVDWALRDEDGAALIGRRTTGALHNSEQRITVNGVRVLLDTGRGPMQPQGPGAIIDPLVIFNPLPQTYTAVPVTHNYRSTGGVRPHVFSIVAGALPAGLSMDSAGLVTGTPTTLADYAWRVQVRDAQGFTATLDQGVDVPTGIDGGTGVYTVTLPPATVVTNRGYYTGTKDNLALNTNESLIVSTEAGSAAVSADGRYLVCGQSSAPFMVYKKWNGATGVWTSLALPAVAPTSPVTGAAFNPITGHLAIRTGSANGLYIYEQDGDTLTNVTQTVTLPGAVAGVVCWSDDGKKLAVSVYSTVHASKGLYVYGFVPASGQLVGPKGLNTSLGDGPVSIDFIPGTPHRYLAAGTGNGVFILDTGNDYGTDTTPMRTAASVSGVGTGLGGAGVFWDSTGGYVIAVSTAIIGSAYVYVYDFDGSVIGTETLTAISPPPVAQPAATPDFGGCTMDYTRKYLFLSLGTTTPYLYDVLGTPPTMTAAANQPPAAAGSVIAADWSRARD